MYCPNCGQLIGSSSQSNYCTHCGFRIKYQPSHTNYSRYEDIRPDGGLNRGEIQQEYFGIR